MLGLMSPTRASRRSTSSPSRARKAPTAFASTIQRQLDAALRRSAARRRPVRRRRARRPDRRWRRQTRATAGSRASSPRAASPRFSFPAHSTRACHRPESMEANTFATTVYARTSAANAFRLPAPACQNLDEWTLGSRCERASTTTPTWARRRATRRCSATTSTRSRIPSSWRSSGESRLPLARVLQAVPGVRVSVGVHRRRAASEDGSYIHWVSVIDPARRTPMIMQGIEAVHRYEGRGLKAALERRAGLARSRRAGRWRIETDTMYVDASIELAAAELGDPARLPLWAPLFRADPGAPTAATSATSTTAACASPSRAPARRLRAGRAGLRLPRARRARSATRRC
mgnify:CR=1 FL=1